MFFSQLCNLRHWPKYIRLIALQRKDQYLSMNNWKLTLHNKVYCKKGIIKNGDSVSDFATSHETLRTIFETIKNPVILKDISEDLLNGFQFSYTHKGLAIFSKAWHCLPGFLTSLDCSLYFHSRLIPFEFHSTRRLLEKSQMNSQRRWITNNWITEICKTSSINLRNQEWNHLTFRRSIACDCRKK